MILFVIIYSILRILTGSSRELCEVLDGGLPQFVVSNQLSGMLDLLCAK